MGGRAEVDHGSIGMICIYIFKRMIEIEVVGWHNQQAARLDSPPTSLPTLDVLRAVKRIIIISLGNLYRWGAPLSPVGPSRCVYVFSRILRRALKLSNSSHESRAGKTKTDNDFTNSTTPIVVAEHLLHIAHHVCPIARSHSSL